MQLFLKILSGMTNSVDPDQTAHHKQSDLGLHSLHMRFCKKKKNKKTFVNEMQGHLL